LSSDVLIDTMLIFCRTLLINQAIVDAGLLRGWWSQAARRWHPTGTPMAAGPPARDYASMPPDFRTPSILM